MNRLPEKPISQQIAEGDFFAAIVNGKVRRVPYNVVSNALNASFGGVAATTFNPGTPEAPIWYLMEGPGNYTHFGLNVTEVLAIASWNGSTWSLYETEVIPGLAQFVTDAEEHMADVANPHAVTKTQVGLGNADNTSDANKPVSTAQAAAIDVINKQSEADAIQLLRLHNPALIFQGFANTTTPTPGTHTANHAWIATESGTIFGISGVVKGQVIEDDGTDFTANDLETAEQKFLEVGKNKFNPALAVADRYYNNSNGAIATNAGWSVTGKQSVLPNTQYAFWKSGAGLGYIHFFDADGVWICNETTISTTTITGGKVFTTPANCYYIASWSQRNSGVETHQQFLDSIQIELGSARTDYEAYELKLKESYVKLPAGHYTNDEVDAEINEAKSELTTDIATAKSELTTDIATAKSEAISESKDYTDYIAFRELPNNLIEGEGTETPTLIINSNALTVSILPVSNDSQIYPNQYPYKRRLTGKVSSGSCFEDWAINYPSPKPSIISFRFWLNDADVANVYGVSDTMQFWWYDTGVGDLSNTYCTIRTLNDAIGNVESRAFTAAGKASGNYKFVCLDKKDGYSCIALTWYDIVYDPSFTATQLSFYFIFNNVVASLYNQKIDYIGFTWLFDEEIVSSNVYPDAAGKEQYPPSLLTLDNKINDALDEVDSLVNSLGTSSGIVVIKNSSQILVRTKFDATRDLVQTFWVFGTSNFSNSQVGYGTVYLIDNTKGNTVSEWTTNTLATLLTPGDDATPNNYNNTYIGGNHGCSDARKITVTGHDKTTEDIGSEWTDGSGRKYYILRIVDANNLWVISENLSVTDIWQFDNSIDGFTLTHSANATHTASMTISANVMDQLLPAIKNNIKKAFIDGKTEITEDGVYVGTYLDIVNEYDIVNPATMLANLIAAVGTTYTDESLSAAFRNGDASVFNQILYRIQKNGALQLIYGWRNYAEIDLGYMGFMQAGTPPTTSFPKLKLYMPKLLPISDGVKSWDFRNIEDFDVAPAISLPTTSAYWEEPLSPPERSVEFLCDSSGNKKVGFALGYDLTKGIGVNRKDLVNAIWYLYTSRKMYPRGIDDKLGNVAANTWYSCFGYRILFDAENPDMGSASSFYHYELGKDVIVVFDYHTTVNFDNLKLPAEYAGRSVTVIEKSDNVTLHTTEVMQDGITVSVGAGAYAYCVLKLS